MITRRELAVALLPLLAPKLTARFAAGTFAHLPYRLFSPELRRGKRYPLVLWLHGGGGRGDDNLQQLREGNAIGARIWTEPKQQAANPCFVVAPQCPANAMWTTIGERVRPTEQLWRVVDLLANLQTGLPVDPARVYVTGQSMGGYATWALLAECPAAFAAAVPICGGGDSETAKRMTGVPVWAFHGAQDRAVPVERSRTMIAAIRAAGGRPRYTEYRDVDHVVWTRAFAEPALLPWVFAQRRTTVTRCSRP